MNTGLQDRVVVITGGGGGIGKACAEAFAAEGARVAIADVNLDTAKSVAQTLGRPDRTLAVQVDVTHPESVKAMFDAAIQAFGAVDVLVNGAGIFYRVPIDDIAAEQWDRLMAVNLKGTFLCCQAALRVMKPRKSGCIVNIASMGGQVGGIIAGADYAASKAGVLTFTKSLAKNAGPFGIRVNSVNPGVIITGMTTPWGPELLEKMRQDTPLQRNGTPEDVAGPIVFLASDQAAFVHGTHLDINGGRHMA